MRAAPPFPQLPARWPGFRIPVGGAGVAVALLLLAAAASADDEMSTDSAPAPETSVAAPGEHASAASTAASVPAEGEAGEETAAADPVPELDPCSLELLAADPHWVDRMQGKVMETVCSATRWFDGYFGDPNRVDDYHTSFGRLGLAMVYDEVEDVDLDTLFKARIELPNLENRVSAFVGRFEEDEFVKDREDSFTSLPRVFADTENEEWLLGLGYRPPGRRGSRFDVDAGIRLGFPMDPFIKGRWRVRRNLSDLALVRFRETVFWRDRLGLGATSQVDVERMIFGSSLLARWRTEATLAEKVEGVDWQTSLTLYQQVGERGALAYEAIWDGETDAPVTVEEAGVRVIFRHRFLRDWFFLEYRARSRWVRESPDEDRVHSFGAAFGFEMLFGRDIRRSSPRRPAGG